MMAMMAEFRPFGVTSQASGHQHKSHFLSWTCDNFWANKPSGLVLSWFGPYLILALDVDKCGLSNGQQPPSVVLFHFVMCHYVSR